MPFLLRLPLFKRQEMFAGLAELVKALDFSERRLVQTQRRLQGGGEGALAPP